MDNAVFAAPDREESIDEIILQQRAKPTVLIVRELLHQIRTVLRTGAGATQFRVSVSSLDPAFANVDLYRQQREVIELLQADLPEIAVRGANRYQTDPAGIPEIHVHTDYEFCWYGGVSGGLCCSMRRPRHRLIATVTVAAQAGTGVS